MKRVLTALPKMRASIAITLASISVISVGVAAGGSQAAGAKLAILGFQSDSDPVKLIDRNADAMTIVGIDGINLLAAGQVSTPAAVDLAQLARAHADGRRDRP